MPEGLTLEQQFAQGAGIAAYNWLTENPANGNQEVAYLTRRAVRVAQALDADLLDLDVEVSAKELLRVLEDEVPAVKELQL